MPKFQAVMKKASLKTTLDKETGAVESVVTIPLELMMDAEIWEFIGDAAGDVVNVTIEKAQIEMPLPGAN